MSKRTTSASGDVGLKPGMRRVSQTAPFLIIFVSSFALYYYFTSRTPPFGDDILLEYIYRGWFFDEITAERVTRVGQIIEGMMVYYKTFRGRVFAEGLVQIFAVYGKAYFDVLNALIYTMITVLVYLHSNYGKAKKWPLFLLISAVYWLLNPDLMETSLWMSGSLHECWVVFFALLFLLPYRMSVSNTASIKRPIAAMCFVVPTGFLAGAFNERIISLTVVFAVLYVAVIKLRRERLQPWSIAGLIATIAGSLFVLMTPATLLGLGSNPLMVFMRNFPGNVLLSILISIAIAGEFVLLSTIILLLFRQSERHRLWCLIQGNTEATNKTKGDLTVPRRYVKRLIILLSAIIAALFNVY